MPNFGIEPAKSSLKFTGRLLTLSFLLFNVAFSVSVAQQNTLFDQLYLKADSLFDEAQDSLALVFAEKSFVAAEGEQDLKSQVKAKLLISICQAYLDQSQAAKETMKSILAFGDRISSDSALLADIWHRQGVVHYILDEYDASSDAYEKAFQIRSALFQNDHPDYQNTAFNLGVMHAAAGNTFAATSLLEQFFKEIQDDPQNEYYQKTQFELAKLYRELNDFQRSEFYFDQILSSQSSENPISDNTLSDVYNSLGIGKSDQLKFNEAIDYYSKALSHSENTSPVQTANLHNNLGGALLETNQIDEAIAEFEQAFETYQKPTLIQHARCLTNLGLAYTKKRDFSIASRHLQEALDLANEHYVLGHPELAIYQRNISAYYFEDNQLDSALLWIQKAINSIVPGYDAAPDFTFPEPNKIEGSVRRLIELLQEQIEIRYAQWSENTPGKQFFEHAFSDLKQADQLIDYLFTIQQYEDSKFSWRQRTRSFYQLAIEICNRWQSINSQVHPLTYYFFEKSKCLLLLQQIQSYKAKTLAGIPDSLQDQERRFRNEISVLEKESLHASPSEVEVIQAKLFHANEGLITLNEKLRESNKFYAEGADQLNPNTVADVQALLSPDQSIMSYHLSDTTLMLLQIKFDTIVFFNLANAVEVQDQIKMYKSLMTQIEGDSLSSSSAYEKHLELLGENLYTLYQLLFPSNVSLTERVIIIPDGAIGYLSFQTLLNAPARGFNCKNWPFLWKNHRVSYSYSGTLWLEGQNAPPYRSTQSLAIAPQFDRQWQYPNKRTFPALSHNQEEATRVAEEINGTLITGISATRKKIWPVLSGSSVTHFATHASIDEDDNAFSYIALSSGNDENENVIYAAELAQLNLKTNLLALSACETGTGSEQIGEGISSIARSFYGAGAKSLFVSLWNVNDLSTANLMANFYHKISSGNHKDDSWQMAISQYFEEADSYHCHPFFWGAFMAIGNMDPIQISKEGLPTSTWLLILIPILILVYLGYKSKRSSSR